MQFRDLPIGARFKTSPYSNVIHVKTSYISTEKNCICFACETPCTNILPTAKVFLPHEEQPSIIIKEPD